MSYFKNFENCKVIVRDDDTGEKICDTIVREYDPAQMVISVDSKPFVGRNCSKVSLLLLYEDSLYDFRGTVRHDTYAPYTTIGLFKGKVKEERTSKRYTLEAPAVIEDLIIDGKITPLAEPVQVTVTNISTEGVQLRSNRDILSRASFFQLRLIISGSDTVINNCVMRVDVVGPDCVEYGCKFISLP